MTNKYIIDSSIWMDLYEDRKGFHDEPLGNYALKLLSIILDQKQIILLSDILLTELGEYYSLPEIKGMFQPFQKIIEKIFVTKEELIEAKQIAIKRNLPYGDVIHAILARNKKAILVTRDNHFRKLTDISRYYKPEELI